MSRPAVSQHLRVLLDAGLVTEQRHGRERRYRLVPRAFGSAGNDRDERTLLGRPPATTAKSAKQKRMSNTIRRELVIPQPRHRVWRAITESATLAEWMFPNDFVPLVGHRFTFQVPPNPKMNFEGLTVHCEVLECDPPGLLVFSWSAGGPVENTTVSSASSHTTTTRASSSSTPDSTSTTPGANRPSKGGIRLGRHAWETSRGGRGSGTRGQG